MPSSVFPGSMVSTAGSLRSEIDIFHALMGQKEKKFKKKSKVIF
jgi:hypothetical protein